MQEANHTEQERERRTLLVFEAGARHMCVPAEMADRPVEWRRPTPLPRAPKSVLGVVSVRGRILTVLDPLALLDQNVSAETQLFKVIIPLRGDEQLALAAAASPGHIEILADAIGPPPQDIKSEAVLGMVQSQHGPLLLLKVQELFAAALQGADRRRQRF